MKVKKTIYYTTKEEGIKMYVELIKKYKDVKNITASIGIGSGLIVEFDCTRVI